MVLHNLGIRGIEFSSRREALKVICVVVCNFFLAILVVGTRPLHWPVGQLMLLRDSDMMLAREGIGNRRAASAFVWLALAAEVLMFVAAWEHRYLAAGFFGYAYLVCTAIFYFAPSEKMEPATPRRQSSRSAGWDAEEPEGDYLFGLVLLLYLLAVVAYDALTSALLKRLPSRK